jgi:hypothetical protein
MKGPQDYLPGSRMTFDRIYREFTMGGYNFVYPQYIRTNVLDRLVFVDKNCSDCTKSGSPDRPDFWVDPE